MGDLAALPVTSVNGIGPKKADGLQSIGVETILDLLMHYPRRWIDRTKEATIGDLEVGEEATVLVRVQKVTARRTRNRKTLVEVTVTDGTGTLRCTYFNQPWRERQLTPGLEVLVFGKLELFQGCLLYTSRCV